MYSDSIVTYLQLNIYIYIYLSIKIYRHECYILKNVYLSVTQMLCQRTMYIIYAQCPIGIAMGVYHANRGGDIYSIYLSTLWFTIGVLIIIIIAHGTMLYICVYKYRKMTNDISIVSIRAYNIITFRVRYAST